MLVDAKGILAAGRRSTVVHVNCSPSIEGVPKERAR